jgi:hypothetical protein
VLTGNLNAIATRLALASHIVGKVDLPDIFFPPKP